MTEKNRKHKTMETVAGAAVGAVIAGPVGAVVGGLAAGHVESGLNRFAKLKLPKGRKPDLDDPIAHAYLKRILVPLDFSSPSKRAMRFARQWAMFFGAEVCLLHVVEPTAAIGEFGMGSVGTIQRDIVGRTKAALQQLARAEFPGTIRVTVAVRKGKPFDEIAAVARDMRADLVIIATHGHTGLKRVLLGSTAERVVRHAPCPVLILRRGKIRRSPIN